MRVKPGISWFPALMNWRTAIAELSDGAFKLFVHLSLNADPATAQITFRQTTLARTLGKSRRSLAGYLKELEDRKICTVSMGSNQYAGGTIQIQEQYWPYQSEPQNSASPNDEDAYIRAIQTYLRSRACVHCKFSNGDRQLAREWFQQGVSISHVEQAILIACSRKYISWLNGTKSEPIGSLRYFKQVLTEVAQIAAPSQYWEFTKMQLEELEQKWTS